jgi:hypothetical protein
MQDALNNPIENTPDWGALESNLDATRYYYMPGHKQSYCQEKLNTQHPKLLFLGFKQEKHNKSDKVRMYHPEMDIKPSLGAIVHPIEKGFSKLEKKIPIPDKFPKAAYYRKFQSIYQEPSEIKDIQNN